MSAFAAFWQIMSIGEKLVMYVMFAFDSTILTPFDVQ